MVYFRDGIELRSAEKLHDGLLELGSKGKMRVRPAAQLISATTAQSIKYLHEKGILKNQNALVAAKVIKIANDWFDVLNSRDSKSDLPSIKGAFGGSCFSSQLALLDEMSNIVSSMRVIGHQGLIPFQRGILLSNRSLKGLQKYD